MPVDVGQIAEGFAVSGERVWWFASHPLLLILWPALGLWCAIHNQRGMTRKDNDEWNEINGRK